MTLSVIVPCINSTICVHRLLHLMNTLEKEKVKKKKKIKIVHKSWEIGAHFSIK